MSSYLRSALDRAYKRLVRFISRSPRVWSLFLSWWWLEMWQPEKNPCVGKVIVLCQNNKIGVLVCPQSFCLLCLYSSARPALLLWINYAVENNLQVYKLMVAARVSIFTLNSKNASFACCSIRTVLLIIQQSHFQQVFVLFCFRQ